MLSSDEVVAVLVKLCNVISQVMLWDLAWALVPDQNIGKDNTPTHSKNK